MRVALLLSYNGTEKHKKGIRIEQNAMPVIKNRNNAFCSDYDNTKSQEVQCLLGRFRLFFQKLLMDRINHTQTCSGKTSLSTGIFILSAAHYAHR